MLIFFVINRHSSNLWIVIGYLAVISAIITVSGLYLSMLGKYSPITSIDYRIYFICSKIKIDTMNISNVYNFLFCLLMLLQVYIAHKFVHIGHLYWSLTIIMLGFYYWINSPVTAWNIFILLNTKQLPDFISLRIIRLIDYVNSFIVVGFLIFPTSVLMIKYCKTKIRRIKLKAMVIAICLFVINMFLYFSLVCKMRYNIAYDILITKINTDITGVDIMYMLPVLIFAAATIYTIFVNKYEGMKRVVFEGASITETQSHNFYSILHMYKNSFISAKRIADMAMGNINDNDLTLLRKNIALISDLASERIDEIAGTLDSLKNVKGFLDKGDLAKCINNAVEVCSIPENITVEFDCDDKIKVKKFDFQRIQEAVTNLISNSIFAIQKDTKEKPVIKIKLYNDGNYTVIEVFDNGCGIEKEAAKHIFELFYTTKLSNKNNGVGLYSVNVSARIHGGFTEVTSVQGEYTSIKLILPLVG